MPAEIPPLVPTLIEVGRRTANVFFLILSEKLGDPDPSAEVEVTLFPGSKFRLVDDEAREWVSRLSAFVSRPSADVPRTKVIRRGEPKAGRQ